MPVYCAVLEYVRGAAAYGGYLLTRFAIFFYKLHLSIHDYHYAGGYIAGFSVWVLGATFMALVCVGGFIVFVVTVVIAAR